MIQGKWATIDEYKLDDSSLLCLGFNKGSIKMFFFKIINSNCEGYDFENR